MASIIRCWFGIPIDPDENVSWPKRIGTRIIAFFVKMTGLFLRSITLLISNRIAFDPISIAAYLDNLKSCLVSFYNTRKWLLENAIQSFHRSCIQILYRGLPNEPLHYRSNLTQKHQQFLAVLFCRK